MNEEEHPRFLGTVEYFCKGEPNAPLEIAIAPYAALYLLERGTAHFAPWFGILEKSRVEHRKIAFTYDRLNFHLTSVELVG